VPLDRLPIHFIEIILPDTTVNILWTIIVGTFVLLLLGIGFIMAIIQSKRRDMAAKQHEMDELAKREAKYRNLFENSLVGMLRLVANTWDVLEANNSILKMFGVNVSGEVKQILDSIPAKDKEHISKVLSESRTIKNFETSIRRSDKMEVCVSLSGSIFPQENILEFVIIDITERKRLEARQLRTHRMESIGVLASGIAHDLKNLQVPVKLAAEILKRKISDLQMQNMLTSIGANAEHSIDLVQQVLTFVRGVEGNYAPVNASEILRRVVYAIQETLPSNIEIVSDIPILPDMILGDATQLRQVLVNLISNAKDAMPEGGRITAKIISVQLTESEAELIASASAGCFAVWTISDTGIGIPHEQIEKIFEPFFTTKEIGKGTGLGLSIVAGIVKGHSGFIKVESTVGAGTSFSVYLPAIK
jgi:PAS domain S-box-containing protein